MNELKIFENEEFGSIRAVEIDGEPWLVGKDVAAALGYSDLNKAIAMHVDDEDKLNDKTSSSLGQRGGWLINESGLYALVMSSKLPGARKFKHWVTSEVLPSIRKHGAYMTPETIEKVLFDPDFIIRLAGELKSEREKRRALEDKVETDKPKVEFAEAVYETKGNITVEKFAKVISDQRNIHLGRNRLFKLLRAMGYLQENNMPYQKYIENGYFDTCEVVKFGKPYIVTLITGKGQIKLFEKIACAVCAK